MTVKITIKTCFTINPDLNNTETCEKYFKSGNFVYSNFDEFKSSAGF